MISAPCRLGILATLVPGVPVSFTDMKAETSLSDGNLHVQTRKLADVGQNVFIDEHDCKTKNGITKRAIYKGEEIDVPLREAIIGRTARETIRNPISIGRHPGPGGG